MNDSPGRVVQVPNFRSAHRLAAAALVCFAATVLTLSAAPAEAACGDGIIECNENCDDGNAVAGDGCNQYCRAEFGFVCPTSTDPLSFAPVGRWAFDELTGTVAADDILGNDGSYVGPALGGPGAVNGQTVSSATFDGIDDYVRIPHSAAYFADEGTIAFWYNANSNPGATDPLEGLFSKDADGMGDGGHVSIYLAPTATLRARMQVGDQGLLADGAACTVGTECNGGICSGGLCTGSTRVIDAAAPAAGVWHHVALTFGPAGMRLFIDGALVGSDAYTGGLGTSSGGTGNVEPITLGASQMMASPGAGTPLQEYFSGGLDDLFIYDYQLSDAQIGQFYAASSCSSPGGACTAGAPAGCGDAVLDPFSEQCDDGNLVVGDGCSASCTIEFCGDGILNNHTPAIETCDDGARREGDGCSSDCTQEPGWSCAGAPSVCNRVSICGNNIVEAGELCDGNLANCSADCQRLTACGDGIVDAGEACDDYNTVANDGCSPTCTVEPGWTCAVVTHSVRDYPSFCEITCGDGIVVDATKGGWEQCDDGGNVTGDGCDERCQFEMCGDGFVRGTEQCDDANAVSGDGCSATCTKEAGFVCPAGNGPCIPETTCDPSVVFVKVAPTPNSSVDQACPFDPTLDANADGVRDCADGKHIFAYKAIPAFTVTPGVTTLAFDATTTSPNDVIATIEMAVAATEGDYGAQPAGAWTTVATNTVATTRGDSSRYSIDLAFPLDAAYSFPGGGLLIRVTYVQGDVEIRTNNNYAPYQLVSMSTDYDGVYPWDLSVTTNRAPTFLLTDSGNTICVDNGWMQPWNADTAGCDPGTNLCFAPKKNFPQNTVWCGPADGATSSNCEENGYWSWSSVTRNLGNDDYCASYYLYNFKNAICSSGSCSLSGSSSETLDVFCENCDDGDVCTSPGFSWSTGCTYSEVSPTACWDGDPAKRNVGECSDGLDYCRNPGPECIGSNYGSAEVCDGIDNDCNAVLDDPAAADPTCDDGNAGTADSCVAGACQNIVACGGIDTSCGATSPCQDCSASSGWYYTGTTVPCCDTGQSCMCNEHELRTYYCNGSACAYYLEPVSPDYRVDLATCSTCDDANICTNDSCNLATGLCDNVDSGYSSTCYTGPVGTEGVGSCEGGTQSCDINGNLLACTDVTPGTETCDNFDEDCNGLVDDGNADASCPLGEGCWSGQCDVECMATSECAVGEVCYFENGITPGRCAPTTDACADVVCPGAATCFEGSCTNANCGNDADCSVYSRCYNSGRCLNGPDNRCDGVQCAEGTECVKGACAQACTANDQCDPGSKCFEGYCFPETDPCAGVDCQVSEVCWQGGCYEQCMDSTDCTDPGDVCYDQFRCAPEVDPCFDVSCAIGEVCYQGTCYPDCSGNACVDMADACYDASRCAVDNCEGVQCPFGEACQGGVCYLVCTDDAICQANDPGDFCYGGFCKSDPCAGVQCAVGEVCQGGVCYLTCSDDADCTLYDPSHACYGGICTNDPCDGFLCPTPGEICYGGACYPYCNGEGTCTDPLDVCYDVDVCAVDYTDLCANVVCPTDQICYAGSCYHDCTGNADCTAFDPGHACYDGRCAADACDGVVCEAGDICSQGTCYQYCDAVTSCDPGHVCYNNTCRPDPVDLCAGVVCAVGEDCYQGVCYETCTGTIDCSNPNHVCYDSRCQDPCEAANCLAGETCYLGTCYEYCDDTADCSNPDSVCYSNRCVSEEDPWCDGVVCPGGEDCYRGTCYATCGSDTDCAALPYDSICYQSICLPTDCSGTTCDAGEICYQGACYEDCTGGTQCSDPSMACYDNRCAASACEAQATTFLADYDSNHVFRRFSRRLYAFQYSTPWMWPRPYESGADSFATWAQIGAGAASSSNNDALYAKGAARLVFYFDDTIDAYILYLIQGSKDAAQGATEATYGIRVKTVDPQVIAMDDPGAEAFHKAVSGNAWRYVQVNITTGPSETGGVAIGSFKPDSSGWRIEVTGHFSGDIDRWEMMNGETGDPITTLHMGEPVSIRNVDLLVGETIQPDFGVTQCETGKLGVCKPGSALACTNWGLTCDQTVFPWGFEICDGLDNTCNGLVDTADTSLKFAMVESRQSTSLPWKPWPTIDSADDINSFMNYTPTADDRIGSTNMLRQNGNPMQEPHKVYMAMHRNRNGQFSMPMVVGAASTDANAIEDFGGTDFSMDIIAAAGESIEELFVCWYDDRKPAATDDLIPASYDTGTQRMSFDWDIDVAGGAMESDSAVIRPVWLEGAAGGTGIVEYGVRFELDDIDDVARRWYRHAPKVSDLLLTPFLRFWVRVAAADPEDAYCISNTLTDAGCPLGLYICTPEGIVCSPPEDANCAANCGDWDGDGQIVKDPAFCPTGTDCDDFDPETYEGATEYCNGRDNDCDGQIDYQSLTVCENGNDECGPADCGGNFVCTCPQGEREEPGDLEDKCVCGEGLAP